ncbi:lipopolysaccharide biosynthesis protein [Niabella hirudinis]|uniref:lipopolysaccharide biosynthesis protein n=1 Tax=Niabella hirudinis TaxID=1285929 RepID=UPI003EBD4CA2
MRDFLKSFFSFGVATSIEKLLGFILLPVYTRLFTVEHFGIIDLTQVLISTVSILGILQLETSLQRYYYEMEGEAKKKFIGSIFLKVTAISLLLGIILCIASYQISQSLFHSPAYSTLIQIAAIQVPLSNFSILSLIILRYEGKNRLFLFSILLKVATTFIGVYVFLFVFKLGLPGVFYAGTSAMLLSAAFLYYIIRHHLSFTKKLSFYKKSLKYALPQVPARIGSATLSYANRFFIVNYLTIASVGIYSLSLKLASIIQLIYTAFIMAWSPFMFKQFQNPNHKQVFGRALNFAAAILFPVICLVCIFSFEIVKLVSSKPFYEARFYLGGLCLYFAFLIFKEIVDIGPKITEKTKYLTLTFFISIIVNLSSLFLLIKPLQIKGVVYSMVITNLILFFVSWIVSNKLYYINFKMGAFILKLVPTLAVTIFMMYYDLPLLSKLIFSVVIVILYGLTALQVYQSLKFDLKKK